METFSNRILRLGSESAFRIGEDIRRCEERGMKIIRLNLGEPDFESADNINQVAIESIRSGNTHYVQPQGILVFRESIARQVEKTRGIRVGPERIVVTPGAKPPICYTLLTYVNPGDEVIYPSPGFPIYESWLPFLQAVPKPLVLKEDKGFRFDAGDLKEILSPKTKVLIVNSPSNPTGGVLNRSDVEDIAALILEEADPNIRIYSDEVYEKIVFDGRKHESIASIPSMTQKTILVSGHSKGFAMTGWRLGYAVLPTEEEAQIFERLNTNIMSCVPPFIQEAGRAALENAENEGIVADMVAQFQERRDVVVEGLNAIEGISCARPEGAFYAFPNISRVCERLGIFEVFDRLELKKREETSPSTLFQEFLLYYHGVATLDRRSFCTLGSEGQHYLRISMASDIATLKEGIRRIEVASRDVGGFKKFVSSGKGSHP